MSTNLDILDAHLASIDDHDEQGVRSSFAHGARVEVPGALFTGVDEIVGWIGVFWRAFPDLRHEILSSLEQGDQAAAEVRFVATHSGPLASSEGEIPATGRRVEFTYTHMTRIDGAAVAEDHVHFDQMEFRSQLGLTRRTEGSLR